MKSAFIRATVFLTVQALAFLTGFACAMLGDFIARNL